MFRELALKMGVPREVAMTPKRATQYSSGTTKMLAESLRNHVDTMRGLTKRELQSAIQEFLNKLE